MRWYSLISLMSDSRVSFLLGFVIIVIIFAVALTLVEFNLKKKKTAKVTKTATDLAVDKIRKYMTYNKSSKEKLDFIDKNAKMYFHEIYGTSLKSNYSTLIRELNKHQLKRKIGHSKDGSPIMANVAPDKNEIVFCKAMFAAYYFVKKLKKDNVMALADLLIDMKRNKDRVDNYGSSVFMKRRDKIITKLINIFMVEKDNSINQKVAPIKKEIISTINQKGKEEDVELLKQENTNFVKEKPVLVKKEKVIKRKRIPGKIFPFNILHVRVEKTKKQKVPAQQEKNNSIERKTNIIFAPKVKKKMFYKKASKKAISKIENGAYKVSNINTSIEKDIGKPSPEIKNINQSISKKNVFKKIKIEPVKDTKNFFERRRRIATNRRKKINVFARKPNVVKLGSGVAEKIVKEEKARLKKEGVYNRDFK